MSFNFRISSISLAVFVAYAGNAMAFGMGEIRSSSHLGEGLKAEIPLRLGADEHLAADCFKLIKPEGDLPWLKQGRFAIKGNTLILRSDRPVSDPILQLAIQVGCRHDLQREYTLMLSPPLQGPQGFSSSSRQAPAPGAVPVQDEHLIRAGETPASIAAGLYPERRSEQKRFIKALIQNNQHLGLRASRGSRQPLPEGEVLIIPDLPPPAPAPFPPPRPRNEPPLQQEKRLAPRLPVPEALVPVVSERAEDRLVLSGGGGQTDAPLRLAESLQVVPEEDVTQALLLRRKLFRLEYRMLAFLENQAETAQLPPEERLKALEAVLGEAGPRETVVVAPKPAVQVEPPVQKPPVTTPASTTPWWYWLLGGLGLAGMGALGWREWRKRQLEMEDEFLDFPSSSPRVSIDPLDEFDEPLPKPQSRIFQVPESRVLLSNVVLPEASEPASVVAARSAAVSVPDTTVDESMTHSPIMELADIMLSFGRVKGAAQALEEYIEQNPKVALQPWVKLLEVYRLAGMQSEFEALAKNLNENFNVELIHWSDVPKANEPASVDFVLELTPVDVGGAEPLPAASKLKSIEDMPHILQSITDTWGTRQCLDYIQTLLLDNRGGARHGLPLAVVDELLFLSEILKAEMAREPLAPDIILEV